LHKCQAECKREAEGDGRGRCRPRHSCGSGGWNRRSHDALRARFALHAVHGAGGEENDPEYYAAARGPKQIWKIDTTHTHGLAARPKEYERRVVDFFDRTLLG
jgi:hypothetical protein